MGILDNIIIRKPANRLFFLSILLILVCLPRFNRNALLVKRELNDAAFYIAYVEYFRGETPSAPLLPAFNWRPGIPFVASFLPFEPMTAINIVNVFCLLISLLLLDKILAQANASLKERLIALLLFIFSFPTFYYSTIGYVDAGAVLLCTLALYATMNNKHFLLIPILLIGGVVKESTILILPAAVVWLYLKLGWQKSIAWSILLASAFLLSFYGIRQIAPTSVPFQFTGTWPIFFSTFPENISRPNTYISFMLTLGLPFIFSMYFISRYRLRSYLANNPLAISCMAAIFTAVGLYIFAFFRAAADGRVIWAAYPYLILLTVLVIKRSAEIYTSEKSMKANLPEKILFR